MSVYQGRTERKIAGVGVFQRSGAVIIGRWSRGEKQHKGQVMKTKRKMSGAKRLPEGTSKSQTATTAELNALQTLNNSCRLFSALGCPAWAELSLSGRVRSFELDGVTSDPQSPWLKRDERNVLFRRSLQLLYPPQKKSLHRIQAAGKNFFCQTDSGLYSKPFKIHTMATYQGNSPGTRTATNNYFDN